MEDSKNFSLATILKFFLAFPTARKLEGYAVIEDEKHAFSAYVVPHVAGQPILRIDVKKEPK
jgi:hypothetical protein